MRSLLAALAVLVGLFPAVVGHTSPVSERILIIYNHGSGHGPDCGGRRGTGTQVPDEPGFGKIKVPRWIRRLDGKTIEGHEVEVRGLCSDVLDDSYADAQAVCSLYICRRARLMGKYVDQAVQEGFQRRHVFLAGQSTGAWTALMLKRAAPASVNGLLLTAPAYGGKRAERFCANAACLGTKFGEEFRAAARLEVDTWLRGRAFTPDLNATIVTFHCDAFGEGWELPTEGNPYVSRQTFPPFSDAKEPLLCESHELRYYNGQLRTLCVTGHVQLTQPSCSRNRVRNCPIGYNEICKQKAHSFYRRLGFSAWAKRTRLAETFIAKSLKEWRYGKGTSTSDAPCPFTKHLKECMPATPQAVVEGEGRP